MEGKQHNTQHNTSSSNILSLVDKENYILDGTLMVIDQIKGINQKAKLDENSVRQVIASYTRDKIERGIAYGSLETQIMMDKNDEIPMEELEKVTNFDIRLEQDFEEKELTEEEIAFQIMEMAFDSVNRKILGRIHILDTPEGMKARRNIDSGMKCYVSSSGVEDVVARDKSKSLQQGFDFVHKFQFFKENWKLSFIGKGGDFGY